MRKTGRETGRSSSFPQPGLSTAADRAFAGVRFFAARVLSRRRLKRNAPFVNRTQMEAGRVRKGNDGRMNYSNTPLRPNRPARPHSPATETVFSFETDNRGTHLRLRQASTVARRAGRLAIGAATALLMVSAARATLSTYQPDAWTRGNSSTTSYFGWDVMDDSGIVGFAGSKMLDDPSPEVGLSLGIGVTGLNARIFQGTGLAGGYGSYGHRSSSGNYYSGFNAADFMDDTITATTRGGTGGFTTVVLQLLATPGNSIPGLAFNITGGTFTLQKSLYGVDGTGTGQYWVEWTAPGANLPVAIDLNSAVSSISADSFTVDTHWTFAASPAVNSIGAVPEPTVASLLGGFGIMWLARRRRLSSAGESNALLP